jgi:hypothetical protein
MNKTLAQKEVRRFCKMHDLSVNGSQGIPLLSKGNWVRCCDDWIEAHSFLNAARLAYSDSRKPYPWE